MFWNYYVLKLLLLETITFSDATLNDINIVLCYVLSQYQIFCNAKIYRLGKSGKSDRRKKSAKYCIFFLFSALCCNSAATWQMWNICLSSPEIYHREVNQNSRKRNCSFFTSGWWEPPQHMSGVIPHNKVCRVPNHCWHSPPPFVSGSKLCST